MSEHSYVYVALLNGQLAEAHEAIRRLVKAHRVVISAGGGSGAWKRHVEPEIQRAAKCLVETPLPKAKSEFEDLL